MIEQTEITLQARPRGFHLVTDEVLAGAPDLRDVEAGLLHLWIRHTSASLTVNENASPDVRRDFESWANDAVREDASYWTHTLEGPDDMPAHIKASLMGPSLTLPVSGGALALGTWQGIYLCEHRDNGGARGGGGDADGVGVVRLRAVVRPRQARRNGGWVGGGS